MDQEIKKQLEEIHALVKDNHRIIRDVRRHQLFGIFLTIAFWFIVLIAPFFIYLQYLQPLISKWQTTSTTGTSGPFGLPTSADLQKLINSYKASQ